MAGIISTNTNKSNPLSTVAGYDPERIKLGSEDTVEGRIQGIIARNSPLMQQAQTRAVQQANKRGLLNSSMAVGAGQSALYDAAAPIASQDANTSFTAKQLNQNAGNTAMQFGAGQRNQAESQVLSGRQSLDQIAAGGEQTRQNIGAQTDASKQLSEQEYQQQKGIIGAQTGASKELAEQQYGFQTGIIGAQTAAQRELNEQQFGQQQQLNEQQFENTKALEDIRQRNQESIMAIDLQQRERLMELDSQYRETLQNSANGVSLYSQAMTAISNIGANPDLTPAQRQAGINQQIDMLRAGLDLVNATNDQEFPVYSGTGDSSVNTPDGQRPGPNNEPSVRTQEARSARPHPSIGGSVIQVEQADDGKIYGTSTATGETLVYQPAYPNGPGTWMRIQQRRR